MEVIVEVIAETPEKAPRVKPKWVLASAVLALLLVLTFLLGRSAQPQTKQLTAQQISSTIAKALEKERKAIAAAPQRATQAYEVITPSLVIVQSEGLDQSEELGDGLGSGVVINAAGAILTANHVIDGASNIRVTFADGTTTRASVVSSDPSQDVALLQPETLPEVLVPAVLGGGPKIGDEVYAVGNPIGLIGSMSAGVVSGLNRSVDIPDGSGTLNGLIQFDAAANPGNSGGPLLNRDAQVIGVVSIIANPGGTKSFAGIAFAVPLSGALGGVGIGPGPGGPVQ